MRDGRSGKRWGSVGHLLSPPLKCMYLYTWHCVCVSVCTVCMCVFVCKMVQLIQTVGIASVRMISIHTTHTIFYSSTSLMFTVLSLSMQPPPSCHAVNQYWFIVIENHKACSELIIIHIILYPSVWTLVSPSAIPSLDNTWHWASPLPPLGHASPL